jgi:hypothetical protein
MVQLGAPIEIEPLDALVSMLRLASGHVLWLRNELTTANRNSKLELPILMQLFNDERDRVAKVAKACLDAGVAERQVRLAERYGELLAGVLKAMFEDPELGLTGAQRKKLPDVTRRHLLALEGSGETDADAIEGQAKRLKKAS